MSDHAPDNAQVAAQREQIIQQVANGQHKFRDVRDAASWSERQASTTHNILTAHAMAAAYDRDEDSIIDEVSALVAERDTMLFTLGQPYNNVGGHLEQYLRGRIAGIEFALVLVGVKF